MSPILCNYQLKTRIELQRGVVVGFKALTPMALSNMKKDLGLSMTVSELEFCQKNFVPSGRIDPTIDELYFLDAIVEGHHHSGDFASISRFFLNDEEVMRTYRDLLSKRSSVTDPESAPLSLSEATTVLAETLRRYGRTVDFGEKLPTADPYRALLLAALGKIPAETLSLADDLPAVRLFGGEERISIEAKCKLDDAIILLKNPADFSLLSSEESLNHAFLLRVTAFAASHLYQNSVHAVRAVGPTGLAAALSSMHEGIYTEIPRLPSVFDGGELYDLGLAEKGSLLISVSHDKIADLVTEAASYGISAYQIARAVRGSCFTARIEGHTPFTFSTNFLREISALSVPFLLEEAPEKNFAKTKLESTLRRNAGSFDTNPKEAVASGSLTFDGRYFSAVGSGGLSFRNGVNAVLTAAIEAVLRGTTLSDQSFSTVFSYPATLSSINMAHVFEAYLGVYRALAELALPSETCFLPNTQDSTSDGGFAVYNSAKRISDIAPSRHFVTNGNAVYLLIPRKDEKGLPSFAEMRKIIAIMQDLIANGKIVSATVGCNTSPISEVVSMCGSNGILYRDPESAAFLKEICTGPFILFETNAVITGFQILGFVKALSENIPPTSEEYSVRVRPLSRRKNETPTVLLCPISEDGNLQLLAELFREKRTVVRNVSPSTLQTEADGANILVFCGRPENNTWERITDLLNNPRTAEALRDFCLRDGIVLAHKSIATAFGDIFGSALPLTSDSDFMGAGFYAHSGLSKEMVEQVTDFYR